MSKLKLIYTAVLGVLAFVLIEGSLTSILETWINWDPWTKLGVGCVLAFLGFISLKR